MIELGKKQILTVMREKAFGMYLGEEDSQEAVLLPKKQIPEGTEVGSNVEVFVYRDSEDRMIATTKEPKIELGKMNVLTVREVSRIGAFLDWGLDKDLFLPFKEQTTPVRAGDSCLVALYLDKSRRLCATMKVYERLSAESPYKEGDHVTGTIYRVNPEMGLFIAVDNQYFGFVPKSDIYDQYRTGDTVKARVSKLRTDGKLNLSLTETVHLQMNADADRIMETIEQYGGILPFSEKAAPERIKSEMKMSKNAFKRALGRLLKEGKIEIGENEVRKKER